MKWSNWSGSVVCDPADIIYPDSEEAVVKVVKDAHQAGKRVRIVGSGHSFVPLVATNDILISLDKMQGITHIDHEKQQITVRAGTKMYLLTRELYQAGFAPENLGDIDVQSIAGAISTGTHGTGAGLRSIANQVVAMRFVTGNGEIVSCSETESPEIFKAAQVSLGALGIITELTLQCLPSYRLHLKWFKSTLSDCLANYARYCEENRHFEFFWIPHTDTVMIKMMNMTDEPTRKHSRFRHFNEVVVENAMLGLIMNLNTWFGRSRSFAHIMANSVTDGEDVQYAHNVFATERNVRFQEMEYNIPVEHFADAIREIDRRFKTDNFPVAFPIECRFVHRDDIYMSPAYERDAAYIAIHEYHKKPHENYFRAIEPIFGQYGGRPHWGKMHHLTATDLKPRYPMWDKFQAMRQQLDPEGVFMNDYLQKVLCDTEIS